MKTDKDKKIGRPKKPEAEREAFGITIYFTEIDFAKIKAQAKQAQYTTLSRYLKDLYKRQSSTSRELQRSLDNAKEAYRSYAAALANEVETLANQSQNFRLPQETLDSIHKLDEISHYLSQRVQ